MIGPVAVLDVMSEAMQAKVREIAQGLDLQFPASTSEADFTDTVRGASYIVARGAGLPEAVLRSTDTIKLVHQWGTGTDQIPLAVAKELGVPVARSPGVNAPTVADLTIAMMLAVLRRLPQHHNNTCAGNWIEDALIPGARDLNRRTVGLIGFGAIGQLVAKRLIGFDCDVIYYRRSGAYEHTTARLAQMDEILATCDIVSLHLPLTPATEHTLGATELAAMKQGAFVVNTGRGGLIDETALIAALQAGSLSGAALDVFVQEPVNTDNPLLQMDNVVALPHIGGRTEDNLNRMVAHWAANIRAFDAGRGIDETCLVT